MKERIHQIVPPLAGCPKTTTISAASRLAIVLFAAVVFAPGVQARLNVVNGDFSDLSGLMAANEGWYGGMPNGWQGTTNTYSNALPR